MWRLCSFASHHRAAQHRKGPWSTGRVSVHELQMHRAEKLYFFCHSYSSRLWSILRIKMPIGFKCFWQRNEWAMLDTTYSGEPKSSTGEMASRLLVKCLSLCQGCPWSCLTMSIHWTCPHTSCLHKWVVHKIALANRSKLRVNRGCNFIDNALFHAFCCSHHVC